MKVCMVHDLAEAVVGDITPYDGVTKEEKRVLEEVLISRQWMFHRTIQFPHAIETLYLAFYSHLHFVHTASPGVDRAGPGQRVHGGGDPLPVAGV